MSCFGLKSPKVQMFFKNGIYKSFEWGRVKKIAHLVILQFFSFKNKIKIIVFKGRRKSLAGCSLAML
jgi:hypothetical protein